MELLMALKGTMMILGIVVLIFFAIVAGELAVMLFMDMIDERRREAENIDKTQEKV